MNIAELYHLRTSLIDSDLPAICELCRGVESVLEIGSGTGRILQALLPLPRLVGVEINPEYLRFAQQRFAQHSHVQLIGANFLSVELAERFDRVLFVFNVLGEFHPVENRIAVLAKARSLLTPGGRVLVMNTVPDFENWFKKTTMHEWALAGADGWRCRIECERDFVEEVSRCTVSYSSSNSEETIRDQYELALLTRSELRAIFAAAGLVVEAEYGCAALKPVTAQSDKLIHVLKPAR
jgi:SAM-dependent methyltransferase